MLITPPFVDPFTDGNSDERFAVGTENGNILLAGELDWETKTDYNLTVSATDGVNMVYSWVGGALIIIT